tara:strand:+ start:1153 stop:1470 length:318 start_codon:yes stop_codon:yes gene_type:complete
MFDIESYTSFGFLFLVTTMIIIKDKNKIKKFFELIKNPMFPINILLVLCFSVYMLTSDDNTDEGERRKSATKQAILGLLIAFMAHIEMKVAPFWLIWTASYYLNA